MTCPHPSLVTALGACPLCVAPAARPAKYGGDSGDGLDGGRGSWCTPKRLTDLIGPVDLDPCSNDRSTVQARVKLDGSTPELDGLLLASQVPPDWRTFLNPGYGRGNVRRWFESYAHVDFLFLLRWDPSARDWFPLVHAASNFFWFPAGWRIEFDPPPGVDASGNPYPHALFCKSRPPAGLNAQGFTLEKTCPPS